MKIQNESSDHEDLLFFASDEFDSILSLGGSAIKITGKVSSSESKVSFEEKVADSEAISELKQSFCLVELMAAITSNFC